MSTHTEILRERWGQMSPNERAAWLVRGVPSAQSVIDPETKDFKHIPTLRGMSYQGYELYDNEQDAVEAARAWRDRLKAKLSH